jgi:hypothetical protein
VGRRGVHDVLEGGPGADLEVSLLDPEARQTQAHEVEDVRDDRVGGQDVRAAGEGGDALRGELLRLLDARRTVIAADASREQEGPPRETGRF